MKPFLSYIPYKYLSFFRIFRNVYMEREWNRSLLFQHPQYVYVFRERENCARSIYNTKNLVIECEWNLSVLLDPVKPSLFSSILIDVYREREKLYKNYLYIQISSRVRNLFLLLASLILLEHPQSRLSELYVFPMKECKTLARVTLVLLPLYT